MKIGATYSTTDYEHYNQHGDKNYFEEVVDAMILEGIAGMNETFRQAISNLPRDRKRMTILSLLDKDLNLFKRIKALTDININKMDHIKDIILMLREYVKVGEVEKKKFGEVMTPLELVKEMLATLPEEVWSNPNLKWLDPANGTGPYPIMVIYKLMNGLRDWEPDDEKRYKHIVENMIYVCELQPKNMFLYMCAVDPFDSYKLNIYTGSFLEERLDYHMKTIWGLEKFDIIMGNPPYQEMDGGAKASAKPIYNLFTLKSIKLADRVLFITPSRWFAGGKGLDSFRKYMMESNKIVFIRHFDDATEIFGKNVDITGGVSYFIYDLNHNNSCNFNGIDTLLSKFDIIVKNNNATRIINKFIDLASISKISNPRSYFGIPTNFDKVYSEKISPDYVKCFFSQSKGFEKWIDKKYVKNIDSCYRVATPRANGDYPKFGNLFIVNPNECVSDSYISFYIDTKEQANSLLSYLKTNFANYLLSIRKISQTIKPDTCKWIPIVPFDRAWTDEMLFEYFGLTEEERSIVLNYDKKNK